MSRLEDLTLSQIKDLEAADRLNAINEIWESMARDQPAVTISEEERALLDVAARDIEANPDSVAEWGEFKARLRNAL